jgi:hypothetical protein
MAKYELEVQPIATFVEGDRAMLKNVLESVGYSLIEDADHFAKYEGDARVDLGQEANELLKTLVPQLHSLFTLTLRSEDGRSERRWTQVSRS